jgi:hypothetical protein
MAERLLRCAVVYALLGIGMGILMAASHDFSSKGVHVHINLLGWVSMALRALVYRAFPQMAASPLARLQFWLHNLGLPLMMVGLYQLLHGQTAAEPLVGVGSVIVALAFVAFAANAWWPRGRLLAHEASKGAAQEVAA